MLAGLGGALALSGRRAAAQYADPDGAGGLPVGAIESIIGAEGEVSDGVLSIEIDRDDLTAHLGGHKVFPSAELNGTVYFQSIGGGDAIMNGDFCLKPEETNEFISVLINQGLTVQAFHQHFFDLSPMLWFVHYRGTGEPKALAQAVRRAINRTSTPLPQSAPKNPQTPLDAARLAHILGGSASVGEKGVVTVETERADTIRLGGVRIKPDLGVSTETVFQPLDDSGQSALVMPDFSLLGSEVNQVFNHMMRMGWTNGCLYNQETEEQPQLYFSHMWKVGSPSALAKEVREGLNRTNVAFAS
jgi:hypothetical protein